MENKPGDKPKEGMSVQEIENFGKKYRLELFFCVIFVLATFFGTVVYDAGWSILLAGIGGVVGIWIPEKIGSLTVSTYDFVKKQKPAVRWVIAAVCFLIAIFIPMLVFLDVGLACSYTFYYSAMKSNGPRSHDDKPPEQK
jgi:hypothetical protein